MLNHIIPCCRKNKSKRDFIESLLQKQETGLGSIDKIDDDIKFDEVEAPAALAKLKSPTDFKVNVNQVGISSIPIPGYSAAD